MLVSLSPKFVDRLHWVNDAIDYLVERCNSEEIREPLCRKVSEFLGLQFTGNISDEATTIGPVRIQPVGRNPVKISNLPPGEDWRLIIRADKDNGNVDCYYEREGLPA